MEALYLLIPVSVAIVFVALWVFFKASDGGQFDDLVGPGLRILQDDDSAAAQAPTAIDAGKAQHPDSSQ
ncbi:MAG TPA: cbb3-type cytochrome oxidase assembly protein CcoS [Janthinobacterium sp.]|nr:cbb3-type cytochrome oxidase assembly protein CcoS [Janthinobacterium sp.]